MVGRRNTMDINLSDQSIKFLIKVDFNNRVDRDQIPRNVFLELTEKNILMRGRRLNEFALTPEGKIVMGEVSSRSMRAITNPYIPKRRRNLASKENFYRKEYKYYVPNSLRSYLCSIKCTECKGIVEIPITSLHQKDRCWKCVLRGRAKRKKETRYAQRANEPVVKKVHKPSRSMFNKKFP